MATYSGTDADNSWTVINPGTFTLDGLGGVDTLCLGTSLRSSYSITRSSDGSVHVDSVSGASGTLHATLYDMERLVFNSGRDLLDLTTYFGGTTVPTVTGTSGNDHFTAGSVSEHIDGLAGIDTVSLPNVRSAYGLSIVDGSAVLSANAGSTTITLSHVERLQFTDHGVALDLDGHAGTVARLLGAVFGSDAVHNAAYAGIGLQLIDGGTSAEDLGALAVSATGKTSHDDIVTMLWTHVVGSAPTAADKAPYVAMLDSGSMSVGALALMAAETALNASHIDLVGLAQTGLDFT